MSEQQAPVQKPRNFIKNLLSFYGTDLLMVAVFLVLTPLLLHHFGMLRFGTMAIADSVLGYLGLLNLGLQPSITRFVAESEANAQLERTKRLMSSAFVLFTGLGLIGMIIAGLLAWNAESLFHLDAALATECSIFIAIKGVELAVMLPLGVYSAANYGVGNMVKMNVIRSAGGVIEVACVLLLIYFGGNLIHFALAALANTILGGLAQRWAMRHALPHLRMTPRYFDKATSKELLAYGSFYSLDSIVVLLVMKSDELVISTAMGAASVAAYSVASKTSVAIIRGVGRLSHPLVPEFSAWASRKQFPEIRASFMRLTDATLALSSGAAIAFGLFGHTLITGWLKLAPSALPPSVVWCFALFLLTISPISAASSYVASVGLLPKIALISIWEGLANLGLSLILVRYMGLTGVILATVVVQATSTMWFNPRVALRHQNIAQLAFWRRRLQVLARTIVPCALVGTLGLALDVTQRLSWTIGWTLLTLSVHGLTVWQVQRKYSENSTDLVHA